MARAASASPGVPGSPASTFSTRAVRSTSTRSTTPVSLRPFTRWSASTSPTIAGMLRSPSTVRYTTSMAHLSTPRLTPNSPMFQGMAAGREWGSPAAAFARSSRLRSADQPLPRDTRAALSEARISSAPRPSARPAPDGHIPKTAASRTAWRGNDEVVEFHARRGIVGRARLQPDLRPALRRLPRVFLEQLSVDVELGLVAGGYHPEGIDLVGLLVD